MLLPKQTFRIFSKYLKFNKETLSSIYCNSKLFQNEQNLTKNFTKLPLTFFSQHKHNYNHASSDIYIKKLKSQIQILNLKLSETQQLKNLDKIIYPQAFFHQQQHICKLQTYYEALMNVLEKEQLEHKHYEHLIKAGDFYNKIHVRRLKALKPYLKAKHQMEAQSLHNYSDHQGIYKQLCERIEKIIKEDIKEGQYQEIQHYYKQGLQNQKSGNQLQSLYYYYKGICISEYQKIPDKLLHFEMLTHYTFLARLMKPKHKKNLDSQLYKKCIQKYAQVQILGQLWWKQQFKNCNDINRKKKFEEAMIWTLFNKANTLFKAKNYQQAIKDYQQAIQFYKTPENADIRIKVVRIIQNLEKCYEALGQIKKALQLLQWAHEFIKQQVCNYSALKGKYLRPINQMMIRFYKSHMNSQIDEEYTKKTRLIQEQLKQIMN